MDLLFMSCSEACVVERFTKVPLSVASHFTFIFFQWKFVFRLEFCNNFFPATLQVKLARLRGEAGIMRKHFCVSSCEIVGAFFSLAWVFPSLWSQPGCLLGRES